MLPALFFLDNRDLKVSKKSKFIKNGSGTASGEFFEVGDFANFQRKFAKSPTSKNSPEAVTESFLIIFDFSETLKSLL